MSFSVCFNTNDQSIGPSIFGCRDDFDFTVRFEELFFSLVPSAIFVVFSLWRIIVLTRRPVVVDAPALLTTKLGAIISYASLELALLILVAIESFNVTSMTIASSSLRLFAALSMIGLSFFDHGRSPRPSILLSAYLSLTLLFDVAQVRTYWLSSSTRPEVAYTSIFTAALTIKVLIIVLEARRKSSWVKWDSKEHSPEETSSIYSLGVYFWLNRLFFEGYRKLLKIPDLYPLDKNMTAEQLHSRLARHLNHSDLKGRKYGLIKALSRSLAIPLVLPIPARVALIGFTFCQPFLISGLIDYLAQPVNSTSPNIGYGFIGASLLIYSGIAISTAFHGYFHHRMLYMARGSLVTAIYTKATEAQASEGDENASLTLMSTDVERAQKGFRALHETWANLIEVAIASWLLYRQLGAAFVAPIVIVILCTMGISVLMKFTGPGQRQWMNGVQKRVGLTTNVIANMKNLKISGLASPIADSVQNLRVDELAAGARFQHLILYAAIFAYIPLLGSPFITFAISRRSLDASRLFTSLSYLILMTQPLSQLFQNLPQIAAAVTCLDRIQSFFERGTRQDFRTVSSEPKTGSLKSSQLTPSTGFTDNIPAIMIENGSFGWEISKMVLTDINIVIAKSSLTMVVGPVASGKTSFCKALLGEMPYCEGKVTLSESFSRVGYCDQTPFLSNASIRDNIVGYSPFDPDRYAEVITATMLGIDFRSLLKSDKTKIGSNGITLSGGQKQRVSLARTLYLQSDLLIFDDVFSGLDADTEDQVFQRVFGPSGILRQRKAVVILCTHSIRHLPTANHIIALSTDGTVVEQGNFADLLANQSYVYGLEIKPLAASDDVYTATVEPNSDAFLDNPNILERATTLASLPEAGTNARQRGDNTVYMIYFKSMGLVLVACIFFSGACFGFFYNFPTVWLTYWAEDATRPIPFHPSRYYLGIYAMLQILSLLSLGALGFLIFVASVRRSGTSLHQKALTTLFHAPLRFITATDQGVIINLFSQDLNLIDTELPNGFLNTIYAVAIALGQAAVIATSSPYLVIAYPFLVALLYVIQKFYLRTSRQLRLLDLEAKSPLYTHFLDTTKGIVTLRAFGFVEKDREKNIHLLDTSQRPAYLLTMIQQWLTLVLNFVVALIAVILITLATQLRSNSGFTGASLVTLMGFGEMLSAIVVFYTLLETSIGAITRLKSFDETVKTEDRDEEDIIPPDEWPQRGEIILNGVSASYSNEEEGEEPNLALKQIHLSIQPGEKVAVCGRTGSGKSSLIALLLKLLEPSTQTPDAVYIDNTALRRIDRSTLRRRLICIPQDAVFLPDGSTFQENLDPFRVAAPEDARSVLEAVGLWPFVAERGGLGTGMTASTLSQGQRQLFSLARAVLRRRVRARSLGLGGGGSEGGVLLLDEVSSGVDRATEKAMQEVIRTEFREYTVLAVSHHLDMIMDFDRVVVMDNGEVVEVGKPAVLADDPRTRFGELYSVGGK
ncbi:ABC multidrug transporter [Biscogniauxia marginata]|nr:ABC multidrug transporter [Biscogniauxia marginata]